MQKIYNWLVTSSTDPEKMSLTIKGFLMGLIPFLMIVSNIANVQVGDLTPVVDSIVQLVQAVLMIVSSVVFLIGFVRKIYHTINGTHAGL